MAFSILVSASGPLGLYWYGTWLGLALGGLRTKGLGPGLDNFSSYISYDARQSSSSVGSHWSDSAISGRVTFRKQSQDKEDKEVKSTR